MGAAPDLDHAVGLRLLDRLRQMQPDVRRRVWAKLTPAEQALVEMTLLMVRGARTDIELQPHQRPPDGDWSTWLLMGGRGIGKTFTGAVWIDEQARRTPRSRWAIVAPTLADARATCVEGLSGLQSINPHIKLNRSTLELTWPNGSYGRLFGAYSPDDRNRLRGPEFHGAWADEMPAWRQLDEVRDASNLDSWRQLKVNCRLGPRPRRLVTCTPMRRQVLIDLLADPRVVRTTATTYDNPHLSQAYLDDLREEFGGSAAERQEMLGELLNDVEGALWTMATINGTRIPEGQVPALGRTVVAVDPPSGTLGTCGIVVAGRAAEAHAHPMSGRPVKHRYVLEDASLEKGTAEQWAKRVVEAYHEHSANTVVAERNQGGDMVRAVLHSIDPRLPIKMVNATKGKALRADPVATAYAQALVHHVGFFPALESQMTVWTPDAGWSPDRLDALVWADTELGEGAHGGGARSLSMTGRRLG